MIDEENQYLVQFEKLMSSQIYLTQWSHNMDLLAIITYDNLLELYRISYKAQKVFQIEEDKQICSVIFSPDSKYIAYGTIDGEIKTVKTENGQTLLSVNDPISQQINSMSFVTLGEVSMSKINPFKSRQILQKLILPISPHKNCNKPSIIKINYFNQLKQQTNFTLLLSSSQNHTSLYINGFIPIANISYQQIAKTNHFEGQVKVLNGFHNQKVHSIICENLSDRYRLHHVIFQSQIINQMRNDIIKFNCLIACINEILHFVQLAYPAAQLYVRDILRQYNSKMNLIDDPDIENVNPCDELFKYLNCGITTSPLINFLTKEVYDSKLLQKLDETLNSIFNSLHDLLLQSIQNSLQRATIMLHQLKSLCSLKKYSIFSMTVNDLNNIQEKIRKLYTMGQILLVQSTQAKFDIRNLLVWLNKATIKSSPQNQNENQNIKSHLSRYTVDFTRLHGFLEKQSKFKLQNLTQFFSKGNQSRPMHIPPCDFRILAQKPQAKQSQKMAQKTKELQKLLEVQNLVLEQDMKMNIELSFRSFKLQAKNLLQEWKQIKAKPVQSMTKMISNNYKIQKIGEIQASQLFQFELKTKVKQNQLICYFVERYLTYDELIQYNTSTGIRRSIKIASSHIVSISIGFDIMVQIQNKLTQKKTVIEVINEDWNGEEIQSGRQISAIDGDVQICAGLKGGLDCVVIDKTKLVILAMG